MLEPAARAPGADARVRQNLALAYALAGDWLKARTTAAQDISPAQLGERMEQWAALAQPDAGSTRVAALLGVTPVADPGQPVRLALAPEVLETRFAEAVVESPAPAPTIEPAPVEVAFAAPPTPENTIVSATVPVDTPETRFAEAVQALVEPEPESGRASAPVIQEDRMRVVSGKGVAVGVEFGG